MSRFRYLTPLSPSGLLSLADVELVAGSLRAGGLAVLPTETGYMLASDATSLDAVRAAFALKGRDRGNPMHVACASLAMARRYAVLDAAAERLMGAFTPGPLTLVLPKTDALADELVSLRGTVGIRVPDCAATLQVIAALERPLTATSLNRSGQEYAPVTPEGLAEFDWPGGEADAPVYVVRHDGALRYERASTLLRVTGPRPEVLRAGPVTEADIAAADRSATGVSAADVSAADVSAVADVSAAGTAAGTEPHGGRG